ncbi:MAG: 50S ribosomal protein L13 [Candidatus Omnitrophica bacterium]|nr:50S ribosomal protein L13 [Candidatus Omnitrophota bacterium]
MTQKTFMAKSNEVERKCYLIDAKDKVLGKVATKAADILRGKHKVIYTPHADTGDQVIIINAEKVAVTGNKLETKEYQKYSGFPSGQRIIKLKDFMKKSPTKVIQLAINRMIPSGALGNKAKSKLKIYVGDKHPHQAQKPILLEV